jgi:hypothetical protein
MLRGATCKAAAMVGTPVLRIVVSNDSIKKATAISQGNKRCAAAVNAGVDGEACSPLAVPSLTEFGMSDRVR